MSARAPLKRGRDSENKEHEEDLGAWIEIPSSSTKDQSSYAQVACSAQPKKGGGIPPKGPPRAPQKGRQTKMERKWENEIRKEKERKGNGLTLNSGKVGNTLPHRVPQGEPQRDTMATKTH